MAPAATDHLTPTRRRRRRMNAMLSVIVCTLLVAGCDSTPADTAQTAPTRDGMPAPATGAKPAVRSYLAGVGAPVLGLHRQVTALVNAGTVRACTATGAALQAVGSPSAIGSAAAGVPDPVLTELTTDELVAITTLLSGCQTGRSTAPLRGVDHELTVRLGQLGMTW